MEWRDFKIIKVLVCHSIKKICRCDERNAYLEKFLLIDP